LYRAASMPAHRLPAETAWKSSSRLVAADPALFLALTP
jgi:hypothetical protein